MKVAMSYQYYNPNPVRSDGRVSDCAVRAVAKALDITWERAYSELATNGFLMGDLLNSAIVWGSVLRMHGFSRDIIPNTCSDCYTVADFCNEHPDGIYVLKSDNHVATVVNGVLYDSWNSSMNVPQYYWYLPKDKQKGG